MQGEGDRQHPRPERMLDFPAGHRRWHARTEQHGTGETLRGSLVGQDRAYKVGRLKVREAGRESEGPDVPEKACKTTRWRVGWSQWNQSIIVVTPETVVRWHRAGFRMYWRLISRVRGPVGRRPTSKEARVFACQTSTAIKSNRNSPVSN
jgi:hypothetical protein